jgi:hypothetical protein
LPIWSASPCSFTENGKRIDLTEFGLLSHDSEAFGSSVLSFDCGLERTRVVCRGFVIFEVRNA